MVKQIFIHTNAGIIFCIYLTKTTNQQLERHGNKSYGLNNDPESFVSPIKSPKFRGTDWR